ncbi:LOW QUALITY PROTEIN: dimethylnonatriene synthase-like [Juglans regia]|uniref:LOW QUALITY PROTEIN: dimethylnonatriene synthase-like n=2 Tax=Juglans regia TaxID=51240 RepID=A0A2I4F810_JUGRE|nr:LOW QUALITY PROTEIN: dimethylnonatriene synthase-like [Juglans regia]
MEFFFQTILALIALLLIFSVLKKIASRTIYRRDAKIIAVPEPSGALPILGHLHLLEAMQGPAARTLGAMADKFGSLFSLRFGLRRVLVVSSSEMAKECVATNDRVFATRASIAAGKYMGYNDAVFALAPYGQYWRDVRKMAILELLSSQPIEKRKHVRASEVESLVKDVYSVCENNGVVDISDLLEHMAFNIILRVLVGKRFSGSEYRERNSEGNRIRSGIKEALRLSGVFVMSDAIPYLEWMDFRGHVGSMKRTAKELDSVVDAWLNEHLRQKSEGESNGESDFMDAMLSTLPADAVIAGHTRDIIIKATTVVLILTGAGSTAATLTWALSLLLNHPKVLEAAQEELDIHVGRERWVQESDINNLNYLQAIVKETLRLYPPGPLTGLREAMQDCNLGGFHVSKGTRLIINLWKLQRDPQIWSNPSEFQPERFLTTHADINVWGQNFEYIPFSSGRRSCPGTSFGLQVVHLALARLLQGFDISTMGGVKVDMREGLGVDLPKVDPLVLVPKPRLPMELY